MLNQELNTELDEFTLQYLVTALWSSNDESTPEGGEPFDRNYTIEDIASSTIEQAVRDCKAFLIEAATILAGYDLETAGHDFWLTRNHHGAGFWDGDYGKEDGDKLTELSQKFRELSPILGDDGKIYFE